MEPITKALCAGIVASNMVCIEPAYMAVEVVIESVTPQVYVLATTNDAAECMAIASRMKPLRNGFRTCIGADEYAEAHMSAHIINADKLHNLIEPRP